jgi:aminoglycoside phosphotransferase
MRVDERWPLIEDAALRGGDLVLAPAVLEAWLSDRLARPCRVEPRRLRYKAGTSAVLAFDLTTERRGVPVTEACVARTYSDHASAKLEKARRDLAQHAQLARDDARLTLVTTAAGDRALPLLPRLGKPDGLAQLVARLLPDAPDTSGARTRTLRHNPGRRWVGTLERNDEPPIVLRAYDGAATMMRAARCYRSLAGGATPTPQVVARSRSFAVLAVTWMDGLDLGRTPDRLDLWAAAGRGLARLHDSPGAGLQHPVPGSEIDAVRAAGRQLADLVPEIGADVLHLARATARELERLPSGGVAIHGDYSPDQVVTCTDGRSAVIDLDGARLGTAAHDLGCLTASTMVRAETAGDAPRGREQLNAFLTGYDEVRRPPDASAVALHAVAFRLRKAVDPFRECAPDWRAQVVRRVVDARSALDDLVLVRRGARWA